MKNLTREEEIEKEAHRVSNNGDEYTSFIQGAEWADKTMIEKACKWLKENIDLVAMDTVNARSGYHEIVMMNDFERKFREAMEE